MLDLTRKKPEDALRVFQNAIKPNANQTGFIIMYHQGNFGDQIADEKFGTALGKFARQAYERGLVDLVQKKVGFEEHMYYAVVK